MKKNKLILIILLIIIATIVAAGQIILSRQSISSLPNIIDRTVISPTPATSASLQNEASSQVTITIVFDDKTTISGNAAAANVFEALEKLTKEKNLKLSSKKYDVGVLVTKIGDSENSSQNAWLFSVNGKPGEIAADKYSVKPQDRIEWKYTKM